MIDFKGEHSVSLTYKNLDEVTRGFMREEVRSDTDSGVLYISPRLNEKGVAGWPSLLCDAVANHSDAWLAMELVKRGFLRSHEERRKPSGGVALVRVPVTANETLAEGEFNRFYARGLCLRALKDGIPSVVVYRARHSDHPRPQSESMIGKSFSPRALLDDLRSSNGVEPALGVPPGPNSGISIQIQ